MEFFFGIIAAVGGFFGGLFGGTDIPEPVVEAPVVEEVIVATTTEEVVPDAPVTPAPNPVTPVVTTPSVVPVVPVVMRSESVVATTSTTTVQKTSSGSSSTSAASLSITSPKLSRVTEKDELSFTATFKKSDGSTEDVTTHATWEVVGPIGSISKGVFTAKLSSEFSEFGAAPGAVRVTYQGMSAETEIFEVEAYVPDVINTKGQ